MTTAAKAGALRRLLTSGGLRAVYQPIIDLDTYAPVAYEALARGPQGSPLESPPTSASSWWPRIVAR